MNTFALDLDISKVVSHEVVVMRQTDHEGTTIQAKLFDHGVPYAAPSGANVKAYFVMRLPGGRDYYRQQASYANGSATVTVDEEYACAVAGRTDTAYFEVHQGTTVIASTSNFTVVTLPSATLGASEGQRYDDEIAATVRQWLDDHPEATTTVQDDSLTADKLKANSVTTPKVADGAVTTAKLDDGAVTTAKLADGSVTTAKVGDGAITSVKIADGTIATADLADGSVTTPKLAAKAVTSAKVDDGAIGTVQLADASVTTAKIAGSVFSVMTDSDIMALFA